MRGMPLRSPPLHQGLLYFRLFVHLPSGSLTRRGLIVCVQWEHWTCTSTELPCGEGQTDCWNAMVPFLLPASKRTLSRRRSSSWRGTSQVKYVSMVPQGNKTLRCRAILPASLLELCFIPRSWRRLHLTCFYASWSWRQPHLTSRHQFEWLHIWFRAWYRWRRSPRVFQRSILFLWETTLHT